LAIKPQLLDQVAPTLGAARSATLISILAGVEGATLAGRVPAAATVRAMPNLPVSLGRGVVALHSTDADAAARATAEALMTPLGLVEWVADEALFHAVTALSGSGPGFVYRFIEAMAAGGAALGLPADQAQRFAIATVEGAAALAASTGDAPAALAERVASPGGTTRAGLDVLDADGAMKSLIAATLTAAARRGAELSEAARQA
jgi:pyrroline-5-carboxylate reductase